MEMLGSAVGRRMAAAAAALVSGGVGAAAVATPAAAAGPPGPDPRNTHYQAYVKQALSGVLKHGMPSKDNIKYRDGNCLAYDRATRNPRWVRQQSAEQRRPEPAGCPACAECGAQSSKARTQLLQVGEHLTAAQLALGSNNGVKRQDHFLEDPSEPPIFRARLSDYKGSGFDRGHMAAAADMKQSQHAMDSTFFLSNMCPQVGAGFNRDYWARFEQFAVRRPPILRQVL